MDGILPVPQKTWGASIKLYLKDIKWEQEGTPNDEENRDCLIRIYLGDRKSLEQRSRSYYRLRNFPLRLNMIEEPRLDKSAPAVDMTVGLAIIYW